MAALAYPPLSLYIHFPWCVRKCPYCDFNSHETNQFPEADYITALIQDLENDSAFWQASDREIVSIFMGGGTPSLFSAQAIDQLLQQLQVRLNFAADIEITMEANPGTFEQDKFAAYRQAGINRLSIGVQSFNPQHLNALGRIHNSQEAQHAIEKARQAGFENINLDLMHGLPAQTVAQALTDIETAIALKPSHISWYQLTIEPNTVFYSKPPRLPQDDTLWDIQEQGQALLAEQGFNQYEVSAYSQPGKQCRHNLNYWQFGDYLALGAGAHGKITDPNQYTITRYQKTRLPKDYLDKNKAFTSQQTEIPEADLAFEFFMNSFRLNQGASKQGLEKFTGLSLETVSKILAKAQSQGLITETSSHWIPTKKGHLYLNDLLQLFL